MTFRIRICASGLNNELTKEGEGGDINVKQWGRIVTEGDPRWPPLATVSELPPPLQLLFSSVLATPAYQEGTVLEG